MLSGLGSPETVVPGVKGQKYVDITTGDLYMKMAGTQKRGWVVIGKALAETVSLGGSFFNDDYGGAEPGVVPPTGIGVAIDTSNGHIWWYYGGQWNG